jgi:hypothetical protein
MNRGTRTVKYAIIVPIGASAIALALSSCSTNGSAASSSHSASSSSGTQTPGSSSVANPPPAAPGTNTPEEAVEGLIKAELSGKLTQSCAYIQPADQASCTQTIATVRTKLKFTGSTTIDGADISGNYALVEITGNSCITGNGCQSNNNPSFGMPRSPASFMTVYDKAISNSSSGNTFSPVPCVKVNGKWYVSYTG